MSDGNGFAAGAAFVDGRYVPVAEASIPILDWGFLRGDATYDVVHVWDGSFFRLEEHLDRFERSIARLFYSIPFDRDAIAETLHRCVAVAGLRDAFVEMLVTRGIPRNRDPRTAENRFAVSRSRSSGSCRRSAATRAAPRNHVDRAHPRPVRRPHRQELPLAPPRPRALRGLRPRRRDAVLVDAEGHVLEGPGFNVYAVSGGGAVTPGEGVLEGVTRGTAAELLARRDVPVAMRRCTATSCAPPTRSSSPAPPAASCRSPSSTARLSAARGRAGHRTPDRGLLGGAPAAGVGDAGALRAGGRYRRFGSAFGTLTGPSTRTILPAALRTTSRHASLCPRSLARTL